MLYATLRYVRVFKSIILLDGNEILSVFTRKRDSSLFGWQKVSYWGLVMSRFCAIQSSKTLSTKTPSKRLQAQNVIVQPIKTNFTSSWYMLTRTVEYFIIRKWSGTAIKVSVILLLNEYFPPSLLFFFSVNVQLLLSTCKSVLILQLNLKVAQNLRKEILWPKFNCCYWLSEILFIFFFSC